MKAAHSPLTPLLVPAVPALPLREAPRAPKRAKVADRVARSFPPLACVRGYQYFAKKGVELLSVSPTAIEAEVKGKRTHRASLRSVAGTLAAACTCTASLLGPAACRHVWATLLEVDRQALFEALRTSERALRLEAVEAKAEAARADARASKPVKTVTPTTATTAKAAKPTPANAPTTAKAATARATPAGATTAITAKPGPKPRLRGRAQREGATARSPR